MYFIKPVSATEMLTEPAIPWHILPYMQFVSHQNPSPKPLQTVRPFHARRKCRARNADLFHNTMSRLSLFDANFTIAFFSKHSQNVFHFVIDQTANPGDLLGGTIVARLQRFCQLQPFRCHQELDALRAEQLLADFILVLTHLLHRE